jgi:transcription-repair coupling factor (superfamily II helicase)
MESILNNIRPLPQYQQLLKSIQTGGEQRGLGLPRAARLPILAALHQDLTRPILLVTDRADHALALFDELGFWVKSPRYHFAEPNPLFYEQAAWGVATRRERLQTLTALAAYHLPFTQKPETPPVFVTSARSLMTRTLPRRDFLKACRKMSAGQTTQPDALARFWTEIGYQRVNTVLEPGQFSRRGGIMDVWAPAEKLPVRLDFFGDEIETIRVFDPASQRTVEKLDSILITPAREYIAKGEGETEYTEFHIPLLHQQSASLLDYLPQKALWY